MKLSISILILFIATISNCQITIDKSSIDNGGTIASNGDVSIVYTLGETAVMENSNANIHISEGFINPHINIDVGVKDISIMVGISIYPNPAVDIVNIHFPDKENYLISVLTNQGKLLSKLITDNKIDASINMKNYIDGVYLIVIKSLDHEHYKAFNVVKCNNLRKWESEG
jgi:hypothetical protein